MLMSLHDCLRQHHDSCLLTAMHLGRRSYLALAKWGWGECQGAR